MRITMENRVRSQDSLCEFSGGKSGTEAVFFLQTIEIYLVSTKLPIFHTHLHLTTTDIKRSSRRSNVTVVPVGLCVSLVGGLATTGGSVSS